MMKQRIAYLVIGLLLAASAAAAQDSAESEESGPGFGQAAESVQQKLEASISELNALRDKAAEEKIPLSQKLNELESELSQVRTDYQNASRMLDSRTLDLSNLRNEIKSRQEEATYLSNLLGEYIRNFETRLHIAELQRYEEPLEEAKLAADNSGLSEQEVFAEQAELLELSLDRLLDSLGGVRFEGKAVDPGGMVKNGTFAMIGPAAIFQSEDGAAVGAAEQRLGSLEPTVVAFNDPSDAKAASNLIENGAGTFPLDPTLGNAHKIEETEETFIEHVKKGGPVMVPIFVLAGAALLVALFKWLSMSMIRTPSPKRIRELLADVARRDKSAASQKAKSIGGPVGKMLQDGVDHLEEPTELIEEVMFERVLSTRLRLEKWLPFIAIAAASAPLLGLLGTVTGIINTFKLITIFGSGDVKTLSGGISEALITTKFGLIVAIPSLLLHAFLARRARGIVNQMEKAAVSLVNQIGKTPFRQGPDSDAPKSSDDGRHDDKAGEPVEQLQSSGGSIDSLMDSRVIRVNKTATVAEAIKTIRGSEATDGVEAIFVVDEQGKYVGHVPIQHLITRQEDDRIETIADTNPCFVRVDDHHGKVKDAFRNHDVLSIPVLDHSDKVVGRIPRNGDNGNHKNG